MKKIKLMIESASTKSEALNMLETMRLYGSVKEDQYKKGRDLIRKEFTNTK
jgi:hypothetical protein